MAFYSTAIYLQGELYLSQMQASLSSYASPALWTQLLTALVVGLLTAFGFQLLLTNLGIALGISSLAGRLFAGDRAANEPDLDEPYNEQNSSREQSRSSSSIVGLVGAGSLLAVNVVLFAACFLAAKFSQVSEPWGGAIVGLSIWSAYLLILIWVSVKTLNSVAGFVFDWATGGLRQMILAITAAFKPDEAKPMTEAELLANIRQEIQMALSSVEVRRLMEAQLHTLIKDNAIVRANQVTAEEAQMALPARHSYDAELWQSIEAYFSETNSKKLTSKRIDRKLRKLLQTAQERLPGNLSFPSFQAELLTALLNQRDDLHDKKKQRIINQVAELWADFTTDLSSTNLGANAAHSENTQREQTNDEAEAEQGQPLLQEILQPAVEKVINSTLTNLPGVIKGQNVSLSDGLAFAVLTLADAIPHLKNSDELIQALPLDTAEMKPFLDRLLQEMQSNLATLGQTSLNQAGYIRDLAVKPIQSLQQGVQAQVSLFNQQARERVEATRRTAARATWWLFATVSTGAISAALAGAIASGATVELPRWLHVWLSS
ncbi:MAG: hypothetical protein Kow00121_06690 [Elainellaceae cyanobacterium]